MTTFSQLETDHESYHLVLFTVMKHNVLYGSHHKCIISFLRKSWLIRVRRWCIILTTTTITL